jgi:two-component system CheB/CheR fusion protein
MAQLTDNWDLYVAVSGFLLMVELRTVVHKAIKEGSCARKDGVKVRPNGEARTVHLQVIPLQGPTSADGHFLVLFEEKPLPLSAPVPERVLEGKPANEAPRELERRIGELEDELAINEDYMQSVIEEHEASNDGLKSASEKLQD